MTKDAAEQAQADYQVLLRTSPPTAFGAARNASAAWLSGWTNGGRYEPAITTRKGLKAVLDGRCTRVAGWLARATGGEPVPELRRATHVPEDVEEASGERVTSCH
jgi:hypothetical protein